MIHDRSGAFALFAGIFFFIISVSVYAGIYVINKSQETTQAQLIVQIQQKEDDLRPKVLDQIFSLQKKIESVSGIIGSHGFSVNTFTLVERDTHPLVSFESYIFSPKDNTITMKGIAEDYGVLAKQISFLEGDQSVDSVEFGGLSLRDDGRVTFNLKIHVMRSVLSTPQ
ncbi:MAG: hypothetical protein U1A23_03760 [Candidatus Sungbacteria bacterium]|nr:hypothetical protein [Candidatus Sungbacteria bacterium]